MIEKINFGKKKIVIASVKLKEHGSTTTSSSVHMCHKWLWVVKALVISIVFIML
jgi:hypothetical protein